MHDTDPTNKPAVVLPGPWIFSRSRTWVSRCRPREVCAYMKNSRICSRAREENSVYNEKICPDFLPARVAKSGSYRAHFRPYDPLGNRVNAAGFRPYCLPDKRVNKQPRGPVLGSPAGWPDPRLQDLAAGRPDRCRLARIPGCRIPGCRLAAGPGMPAWDPRLQAGRRSWNACMGSQAGRFQAGRRSWK